MHQVSKFKTANNIKGNLFVKNLPDDMDNKALMDKFSSYGNILSCKVSFNKVTGAPLHYGYVHFSDPAVASKVLEDMNKEVVAEGDIYVCEYEKRITDAANDWVECYISDFPANMTKEDLQGLCETYGKVMSTYIGAKRFKPEKMIAFVKFEKHEDAVKAVEGLKEHTFEGAEPMKMYINRLQSREERERVNQAYLLEQKKKNIEKTKGRFLYVGFGSEQITEEKLREMFTPYGVIESLSIAKDKITHEIKPFGFVCMDTVENAQAAVRAMKEKPENKLKVEFAQTREERAKILKERRKQNNTNVMNYPYNYFMPQVPMNVNRNAARKNQRTMPPMMQAPMQPPMVRPGMPMMPTMVQPGMQTNLYPQYTQYMQPGNAADDKVSVLRAAMQQLPAITPAHIEGLSDEERRNVFGERLFTLINAVNDPRVSKITGMMLELNLQDLFVMVSNPEELNNKIIEANDVLDQSQQNGM